MKVGAVDIGTNSVRLLITDGRSESQRWVEVTGLGRGVDATGMLSVDAIERTIPVLARYGELMDSQRVERRRAIATSASREARNRDEFFDLSESALRVRPMLISGDEEARLAYQGATFGLDQCGTWVVSDIGGGSTELVTGEGGVSVDMGSVRLTERHLPDRPPLPEEMADSREHLRQLFSEVEFGTTGALIGVAGTWTSLAAIALELPTYDRTIVHRSELSAEDITETVERLTRLTVEQTAAIPSLDPNRAPVILAGGLIAEAVMETAGADSVLISESDTLEAVAGELLALP